MMLSVVKNASGLSTLKITIKAIRLANASSFCLAWLSEGVLAGAAGLGVVLGGVVIGLRLRAGLPVASDLPGWRGRLPPRR